METIMRSKEEKMLGLFFDNPTREWHFEEILIEAKITRSKADGWLKKFIKDKLIKRIKEKGKMPYYIGNYEHPSYQNRKRISALSQLYESGFLDHLGSLKRAKSVIVFGSFARWDWYKNSDIDVFIYGDSEGLSIAKYELKLHRDIQLFICKNKEELNRLGVGLIKNILKGNLIKGNLEFAKVGINAQIP